MLIFFILGCVIAVSLYLFMKRKKSRYTNTKIKFLSAQETNDFLKKDPDGFVASLNRWDLFARHVKTNQEYIDLISQSGKDWTEDEKIMIEALVHEVDPSFDWIIARTDTRYELGFPHTRTSDVIFLSDLPSKSTLKHEKLHLEEKRGKYDFEAMGFQKIGLRKDIYRLRSNPDLDKYVWKDQNGRVYVARYTSDRPLSIMDIDVDSKYEHPFEWLAYNST